MMQSRVAKAATSGAMVPVEGVMLETWAAIIRVDRSPARLLRISSRARAGRAGSLAAREELEVGRGACRVTLRS